MINLFLFPRDNKLPNKFISLNEGLDDYRDLKEMYENGVNANVLAIEEGELVQNNVRSVIKEENKKSFEEVLERYHRAGIRLEKDLGHLCLYYYFNLEKFKELSSKNKQEIILEGLKDDDWNIRKVAASMIEFTEKEEKERLQEKLTYIILEGLESNDPYTREMAAKMIKFAKEEDVETLILYGKDDRWGASKIVAGMIEFAKEEDRANLISQELKSDNWDIKEKAARAIKLAKEEDRGRLQNELKNVISEELESGSPYTRRIAIKIIKFAREENRGGLILKGLQDDDWNVQEMAARVIEFAKKEDRGVLQDELKNIVLKGSEDSDPYTRKMVARIIEFAKEEDRGELILKGSENSDSSVREITISMAKFAKEEDRKGFILKGLKDGWYVKRMAAGMIEFAREEDREELQEELKNVILKGLKEDNWHIQRVVAGMIEFAREEDKEELQEELKNVILEKLESDDWNTQEVVEMIKLAKEVDLGELLQKADKHIDSYRDQLKTVKNHPFYTYRDGSPKPINTNNGVNIAREPKLTGKAYMKTTNFKSFFIQKEAFEAYDVWKELGFDHIPVESILDYSVTNEDEIRSFNKLYDDPLYKVDTTDVYFMHKKAIDDQISRIMKGLNILGINLVGLSNKHICVSWERTSEGDYNLSKPPKLFLVNWNWAESIHNINN
jgi:HEAT repeat protein